MAPRIEEESAQRTDPPPRPAPASGDPPAPWPPGDRLGLGSSAALLGDLARPFAWLGAQALLIVQPTFSLFGAGATVARWVQTLERLDAPQENDP